MRQNLVVLIILLSFSNIFGQEFKYSAIDLYLQKDLNVVRYEDISLMTMEYKITEIGKPKILDTFIRIVTLNNSKKLWYLYISDLKDKEALVNEEDLNKLIIEFDQLIKSTAKDLYTENYIVHRYSTLDGINLGFRGNKKKFEWYFENVKYGGNIFIYTNNYTPILSLLHTAVNKINELKEMN